MTGCMTGMTGWIFILSPFINYGLLVLLRQVVREQAFIFYYRKFILLETNMEFVCRCVGCRLSQLE
jgi:hypothetical protein